MNQHQAHAKAIRLQTLRYGRTHHSAKRPLRSTWYERKKNQLLESVGVVLLLALLVGVEMGLAI